jgi:hypothetical protein
MFQCALVWVCAYSICWVCIIYLYVRTIHTYMHMLQMVLCTSVGVCLHAHASNGMCTSVGVCLCCVCTLQSLLSLLMTEC